MMDQIQNWYQTKIAPIVPPEATATLLFVLACTIIFVNFSSRKKVLLQKEKEAAAARRKGGDKNASPSPPPKDIFETMRKQRSKKVTGKQSHPTDKPFGSSYYYAHNNSNAKGGYADGLAAEDYVMNGPKLLSKGGVPIDDNRVDSNDNNNNEDDSNKDAEKEEGTSVTEKKDETASSTAVSISRPSPKSLASSSPFIPISKYMWDDDGTNGMARIYIETLPSSSAPTDSNALKWEDAGIKKQDVEAKILGEDGSGLLVRIIRRNQAQTDSSTSSAPMMKYYQLHVPKMHGQASEVKTIVKSKRLIIKLTKKRNGIWDSGGNTKAWPYLSASTSAAANSVPIDTDDLMNFSGQLNEDEQDEMMNFMKQGGGGFTGVVDENEDDLGILGWDSKADKPIES